jgi:hypothetical protein
MAVAEAVNITAPIIAASTSKTTPVDADVLPILDSAAANILKKVTWTNIKATLKTYFDTLYAAVGSFAASGANADITSLTALTAGGLPNNSVLTADIADANVTPAKLSQPFTAGTAVATTSGTSIDFTGIPSWVKRVTVMLSGVSTNGISPLYLRIGSGSIDVTGYQSTVAGGTSGILTGTSTTGYVVTNALSAASIVNAIITLTHLGSGIWVIGGGGVDGGFVSLNGTKTLAGALNRLRLTTANGTDTFDAGSVNILYE